MPRKSLHYAVDLDGTLAVYDKWRGHTHIGAPIQLMVDRVKQLLADGHYVSIFTARLAGADYVAGQAAYAAVHLEEGPDFTKYREAIDLIEEWCRMHIGQVLPITAEKKPYFHAILDDRAEQILQNDGRNAALAYRELAKRCLNVMAGSGLDPILLRKDFSELELKLMRDKETP